ncbi:hypothetical protein SAMD00019534_004780 [Acytostelium subglobosum LB1]|uniref:hypothetical protein n=1 Tax=Acytostelium subglobosum LB1 TaxID=1410327 RepID=UPI000645032B|nr:hypothetical protein SAMD00019534_004780 [Acytostelium subglobosum LB1]GAM17303.1 hypothetical protein SAMD00019534_004780 [Acytostelium subglobosum LB1]|eukprot:XP_012759365.1 hypothetical protein SAMD00019534_004780 [Acytostelium subglobosum LB1]
MDTTGNTLSFALSVFETAIGNSEHVIDYLSIKIVEKIISLFDNSRSNISNPSLKIAMTLVNTFEGARKMSSVLLSEDRQESIFQSLIANLNSTDMITQEYTLNLINNLISLSDNGLIFLEEFEKYNLSPIIKKKINTNDIQLKKQIYRLQNLKLQEFIKDCSTQYCKDDANHERLLECLWTTMFEDHKFQRVDERWKGIGFQGKDPSTDFRGMGIAGLKNLLYYATHHQDSLRTLMKQQSALQSGASNDRYYPVAVCGIHITSMLLELIKPPLSYSAQLQQQQQQQQQDYIANDNIISILFDHKNSLEEIYCITMEIFAMVWEEGAARYMDFAKVISYLKTQISDTISRASTIQEFKTNNFVMKRLVDYKKILEPLRKDSKGNPRQSSRSNNSFYDERRSVDYIPARNQQDSNSVHELLSKSYSSEDQDFSTDIGHVIVSSSDGNTPLHSSVNSLSYDAATQQVNANHSLSNSLNGQGMTPLNLACHSANSKMIELLLSNGSNVTVPAKNGHCPMHNVASRRWQSEEFTRLVKSMLDKGADIDCRTGDVQDTPLHIAASKDCDENVRVLLNLGANPNIFNKRGETPLHIAVARRNKDIVELLTKNGADVNLNNVLSGDGCDDIVGMNVDGDMLTVRQSLSKSQDIIDQPSSTPTPTPVTPGTTTTLAKKPPPPVPKRNNKVDQQLMVNSPSHSLTPTPPGSPFITSPSIKSARTPIRHTNSVIGLQFETPASPPSSRSGASVIVNCPPDLNIGGSSGGSNGGHLMSFISRAGRSNSGSSGNGSGSGSGSVSANGGGYKDGTASFNMKHLDATKKKLAETMGMVDQLYSTTEYKHQKETIKRILDNFKSCKSSLKSLK